MELKAFFDKDTYTMTYVIFDASSKEALIIDPVLDYDPNSSSVSDKSAKEVIGYIKSSGLKPTYVLETHAHADHISSSQILKKHFPGLKVAIGERIKVVQDVFKNVFHLEESFKTDGSQFDRLLSPGEEVELGGFRFKVLPTPGHTPACSSYLFEGMVFTGDALFMPDYGTGRCDFPAGSAEDLYDSITNQLYTLPDETRVFVGHDYQPNGRELAYETSIGESKQKNIRLTAKTTKEQFVQFRSERDATLSAPRLLLPSIQVNIRAGNFPPAEANGMSYLKMPVRGLAEL